MGTEILVIKIREVANEIIEVHGPLKFLSLWKDEEDQVTYSLMISATWLDDYTPLEGISLISEFLFERMNDKQLSLISRVSPIHTSDEGRQKFFGMKISNSNVHVINSDFNGTLVKDAYIFELQK